MWSTITAFVHAHPNAILWGLAYAGIGLIETMPSKDDPRPFGQKLYSWLYDFTHVIANKTIQKNPKLDPTKTNP